MKGHDISSRLLSSLFLLLMPASVVWAQNAELNGKITDPQGRLVAGASVRLEKNESEIVRTTSDERGSFRLYDVPPGSYTLRAEAPGFAPISRSISVPVDPSQGQISNSTNFRRDRKAS